MKTLKIAVLVSGRGSNLQAILNHIDQGFLKAQVVLVVSDQQDCFALQRSRAVGLPVAFLSPAAYDDRRSYDQALADLVLQSEADLVVLAGFMRILGSAFLRAFPQRVINIHPALLPSFPGLHGQQQAFDYGVKISGCTVHFVDEGMDTGPIIAQRAADISACQNGDEAAAAILVQEHQLYSEVIGWFAAGRVQVVAGKVQITI